MRIGMKFPLALLAPEFWLLNSVRLQPIAIAPKSRDAHVLGVLGALPAVVRLQVRQL
jgi:hypothetical protein